MFFICKQFYVFNVSLESKKKIIKTSRKKFETNKLMYNVFKLEIK